MWCYFYIPCYNWIYTHHQDATIDQLSEAFYDNFDVKLDNVQVIVAGKGTTINTTFSDYDVLWHVVLVVGDDWEGARTSARSKLHILEKVAINLKLKKSLLPNDTRLPGWVRYEINLLISFELLW